MSTVVLGIMSRKNHGLRKKYDESLDPAYKTFIDSLEAAMIAATYDISNASDCIVTMTCNLNTSQVDIQNNIGSQIYFELESAVILFCQLHASALFILRNPASVTFTVDMKLPFIINYL